MRVYGGREEGAEGERESQVDSPLRMEHNAGFSVTTLKSSAELKARVRRLTDGATQAPVYISPRKGYILTFKFVTLPFLK